jgi:predicted dehydrogenase
VHFQYAIEKGLNVFMEKPVTADGPSSRRMLKLNEEAERKGLRVGVGLNSRHSRAMQQLHERISGGEIGDIMLMRGYRMAGPIGSAFSEKYPGPNNDLPGKPSELLWQLSRFHSFIWASGGCYSDFNIHHIDHLCWMKNAWPVKAQAIGGRHYRGNFVDQNFDSYAVEYIFEDGARLYMDGRCMVGANQQYSSYVHGTKGMAIAAIHLNSHITGGAASFQGSAEFTAGSNGQGAIGMDNVVATGLAEGCSFITNGDTAEGVSINAGGNLTNGNNGTQMQVCIATGAIGTLNSKYMIKYGIAGGDAGQTGGLQSQVR